MTIRYGWRVAAWWASLAWAGVLDASFAAPADATNAPPSIQVSRVTALYDETGTRFSGFARADERLDIRAAVPKLGMFRVLRAKDGTTHLCWPQDIGKQTKVSFARGKLTSTKVPGTEYDYALYIPKSYNPSRPCPLVLCLSTGRFNGELLRHFQKACEAHGWIGIGRPKFTRKEAPISPTSLNAIAATLADARRRIPHDWKREYVSGYWPAGICCYLTARFHWNRFAGLAVFNGWQGGAKSAGTAPLYSGRMAIAMGNPRMANYSHVHILWDVAMVSRLGARCRAFEYPGNTGGAFPSANTFPDVLQWLDEDWGAVGCRASDLGDETALVAKAASAWNAHAEKRYGECAQACVDLWLRANNWRLAEGIENLLIDTLAEPNKTKRARLALPAGFEETGYAILWQRAYCLGLEERLHDAFAFAEAAFATMPEDRAIDPVQYVSDISFMYNERCMECLNAGDFPGARLEWERARQTASKTGWVPALLGIMNYLEGDYDEATRHLQYAHLCHKDYLLPVEVQGWVAEARGDEGGALAAYSACLRKDPRYGNALVGRGLAYLAMRQFDKARDDFRDALAIQTNSPIEAVVCMALTEALSGKTPDAAAQTVLSAQADEPNPWGYAAAMVLGRIAPEEAVKRVDADANGKVRDRDRIRYHAGLMCLASHRTSKAKALFQASASMRSFMSKRSEAELRRMGCLPALKKGSAMSQAPTRLAVYGKMSDRGKVMLPLIEVGLQGRARIELLERDAIAKVIAEHRLAAGGAFSEDSALQVGELLNCDLVADFSFLDDTDKSAVTLLMFDAKSGLRLVDKLIPCEEGGVESAVVTFCEAVEHGVDKWRQWKTGAERVPLSVERIRAVALTPEQQAASTTVAELLGRALVDMPAVALVERKRLAYLSTEAKIGEDWRSGLLATCLLLDVDLKGGKGKDELVARVSISDRDGNERIAFEKHGKMTDLLALVMDMARETSARVMSSPCEAGMASLLNEAARYAGRANSRESCEVAIALAEGALAVNPNVPEHRKRLMDLLYKKFNYSPATAQSLDELFAIAERIMDLNEQHGYRVDIPGISPSQIRDSIRVRLIGACQSVRDKDEQRAWQRRITTFDRRYFEWYVAGCLAGAHPLYMPDCMIGAKDIEEATETYFRCYPFTQLRQRDGVYGPLSFHALMQALRDRESGCTSAPAATRGLADKTLQRLLLHYDKVREFVSPWDRIELDLATMCLLSLYPNLADNAGARIDELHAQIVAIARQEPSIAGHLVDILGNPSYLLKPQPATREKSESPSRANMMPLAARFVKDLRAYVISGPNAAKPSVEIHMFLDRFDAQNAVRPGAYLEACLWRLAQEHPCNKNAWNAVFACYKSRYGDTAELSKRWPEPSFVRFTYAFASKRKIFNPGGHGRIVSAQQDADGVLLLVDAGGARFELRRLKDGAETTTLLVTCSPDDGLWDKALTPGLCGTFSYTNGEFFAATTKGLLMLSKQTETRRFIGPPELPAPHVQTCLPLADRVYLACGGNGGSYIVRCDRDGSNVSILAASIRREKHSPLDNCPAFTISAIVPDLHRNRVLFLYNSRVYGCDLATDRIEEVWVPIKPEKCGGLRLWPALDHQFLLGLEYGVNSPYGESWNAPASKWNPEVKRMQHLFFRKKHDRFQYCTSGNVPEVAQVGAKMFYVPTKKRWRVAQEVNGDYREVDLPVLDGRLPFLLRNVDNQLLAVVPRGVWLLDPRETTVAATARGAHEKAYPVPCVDKGGG